MKTFFIFIAILFLPVTSFSQYFFVLPLPYPIDYLEKIPLVEKLEITEEESFEEEPTKEFAPLTYPDFKVQKNALGYEPGVTFKVPEGLRDKVEFWKLVYHHYSINQYILHDTEYKFIYKIVNVGDINRRKMSYRSQRRLIGRRLNAEKRKIRVVLNAIHKKRNNPESLTDEQRDIFDLFKKTNEKNKFLRAKYNIRSQLGQKERFRQGIVWAGRYLPMMERIFSEEGLPMELTRLPFVESSFNLKARSRVGASGIWQFIRSTGRRFLKINLSVDERNDPIEATKAAARLLKMNYNSLQSWPLAVTAYNHGRAGMMRAIKRVGTRDIVEIIAKYKSPTFGFASKNFYAEFLGALEVEVEYEKYFGKVETEAPLKFDAVELEHYISLAPIIQYTGVSKKIIKRYNPGLTYYVLAGKKRIPKGYELKLPFGEKASFLAAYKKIPQKYTHRAQRRFVYHKVRKGDTLSYLASRYRTSVSRIRSANRLGRFIYAGQTLVIPR